MKQGLLFLSLMVLVGCAADYTPPDPMLLVQNENAFAAATAEKGMRDGFLEYIADNGVLFVPGAVNGKQHYESGPQRPGLLTWRPVYAEFASSGDMGWTTGPWEFRSETMADTPLVYGHYNTIWKLQADSTWKFVLDIGVAHGPFPSPTHPVAMSVVDLPENAGSVVYDEARNGLIETEYTFSAASAADGTVPAYLARIADDVRFYRMGEFPGQGVSAITEALSAVDGVLTWEPTDTDVSRHGDLGYSYGVSTLTVGSAVSRFSYAHFWRKHKTGDWQLTLDIHIPLPVPQEEETP